MPEKPSQSNLAPNQDDFKRSRFVLDLKKEASKKEETVKEPKLKSYLYGVIDRVGAEPKSETVLKKTGRFFLRPFLPLGRAIKGAGAFIFFIFKKFFSFFIGSALKEEDRGVMPYAPAEKRPVAKAGFFRPAATLRPVLIFAILALILILPLKAFTYYRTLDNLRERVLGNSREAIDSLLAGGREAAEKNFSAAEKNFSAAGADFLRAQNELSVINEFLLKLASLTPNRQIKLAASSKTILLAGQTAANIAAELTPAMSALFDAKDRDLNQLLNDFIGHGNKAAAEAKKLNALLAQIDPADLPLEYREKAAVMKKSALFLEKSLFEFVDLAAKLNIFLGENQNKRYLLVFQNNAELRASGGFIGSYALIDFSKGRIKNIEVPGGGSYDTEAGLKERIIAPSPLWLVNPLWHFWDANWWPDWPTTAKKLMWFYEKSDGPTVDGVISLTPTVLEEILRIIGPVDLTKEYGLTIDADNFWAETQALAEQKPDVTKQPKKIIGDLMQKIIAELPARFNRTTLVGLLAAAEKNLKEKQILFYFRDEELENKAAGYGWDGRIKNTAWDYLAVINTNIAGGKSDRKIKEVISHQAEITADGSIVDTLEIKRTHLGLKDEPWSGQRNVDWMRIYAPAGSKLLEASGFNPPNKIYFTEPEAGWRADPDLAVEEGAEIFAPGGTKIYNQFGKTVFANWSMVEPGQTITIRLKYRLPFELKKKEAGGFWEKLNQKLNPGQKDLYPYALLAQKQPGSLGGEIESNLILPESEAGTPLFTPVWRYPENNKTTNGRPGWQIKDSFNADKYWVVLLEK